MIWTNHNYIDHLAEEFDIGCHYPKVPQGVKGFDSWQASGFMGYGVSNSGSSPASWDKYDFRSFSHVTTPSDRSREIMEAL